MWARNSGKQLCAHLLLFYKTCHFMKSTCISCMILTMALFIHLFLYFLAGNQNEDVPIRDYFGFSHALHLPPAAFRYSFWLLRKNIFNKYPKPFLMIFFGFSIRKNASTSEPFAQDLVPILDRSNSLAD